MSNRFAPEEYVAPLSVEEAVRLLADHQPGAGVIAGGTDLLVRRPEGMSLLVDVGRLGLEGIEPEERGGLRVGACTTAAMLEGDAHLAGDTCRLVLREAAAALGTPTVRNRATLGGNLSNGSPAADMAVAVLALEGKVETAGSGIRRLVPIEKFFVEPGLTCLHPDEVVVAVHLPASAPGMAGSFLKLRRHQTSVDIATVNTAVVLRMEEGICRRARIALGAVAGTPMLATEAAALLAGRELTAEVVRQAGETAAQEARPINDIRASASYRQQMVAVLVRRALQIACGRCRA